MFLVCTSSSGIPPPRSAVDIETIPEATGYFTYHIHLYITKFWVKKQQLLRF